MYLFYTKFSLPTHGSASMHSSSDSGYDCPLFSHIPSGNGNSGYDCLLFSHIPSDVKKGSACAVLPSSIPIINDSKTPIIQIPVVQNTSDHKQRTLKPPVLTWRTLAGAAYFGAFYAAVACRR